MRGGYLLTDNYFKFNKQCGQVCGEKPGFFEIIDGRVYHKIPACGKIDCRKVGARKDRPFEIATLKFTLRSIGLREIGPVHFAPDEPALTQFYFLKHNIIQDATRSLNAKPKSSCLREIDTCELTFVEKYVRKSRSGDLRVAQITIAECAVNKANSP